ncbi:LytTR family DNA-binding domain-containing protein [Hyphococcus flavus]|uniref:LytTR family DNA-binding domain-containing protein n=1 Tax=Hyphococcus flavus TaxID=1866326 RepID=A0AAE9ZAM9_9PROT|nr:LytTR family DNA-binding domain-containing protein [Hyphococcus flavus]WDI30758.1 LytTR family DNA-binding domain-containing protein [Hyphococcus flavus]
MTDDAKSTVAALPRDDARADRTTFFWVVGFFTAFLVVGILSRMTEQSRSAADLEVGRYVLYECSSILIILALYPLLRLAVTYAAPGQHDWRRIIAVHAGFCVLFSIIHIAGMVAIRKAVFPFAFGEPYIFTDNLFREFVYEFRKDAVTYSLIAFFITFGRQLEQQRRELTAAREDAKTSQRLTLKCGGRSVFVDASKVVWVKSASNYVEVRAGAETHLARATLGAIENQLTDAGADAIRVHRSWIVNKNHIKKIAPTGEGDLRIEMSDETIVPGSRRYRDRLPSQG